MIISLYLHFIYFQNIELIHIFVEKVIISKTLININVNNTHNFESNSIKQKIIYMNKAKDHIIKYNLMHFFI